MTVPDVLARLLRALDLVVIERQPNHTFYAVTPEPAWFTHAFGDAAAGERHTLAGAFPFLDDFIQHAIGTWAAGPEISIVSGPFAVDVRGEEILLRATALSIDGRALLVIERLTGAADVRPMLQRARSRMLEGEELARRASAVHAPTASLAEALGRLEKTTLTSEQQPIVESLRAAYARLSEQVAQLPTPPKSRKR